MFNDDPERTLILELKERIAVAADSKVHDKEFKALAKIEKIIDTLILCNNASTYDIEKERFFSDLLEESYIFEVSVNSYIRHSLLPLIDVILEDKEDL